MVRGKPFRILIADDDPDDKLLLREAAEEAELGAQFFFVDNGECLMDFLHRRGLYAVPGRAPRPSLLILDLNMPKKDGREVLREIKCDPQFRRLPVIILSTSQAPEDVELSYDLGVNSFIVKPGSFTALVDIMWIIGKYWAETVTLPVHERQRLEA